MFDWQQSSSKIIDVFGRLKSCSNLIIEELRELKCFNGPYQVPHGSDLTYIQIQIEDL